MYVVSAYKLNLAQRIEDDFWPVQAVQAGEDRRTSNAPQTGVLAQAKADNAPSHEMNERLRLRISADLLIIGIIATYEEFSR